MEEDLKLFRELNDRLRAENNQLRQQLRSFGVQFPGTPKNGGGAGGSGLSVGSPAMRGGVGLLRRSESASSPLGGPGGGGGGGGGLRLAPHPLENHHHPARPFTTGSTLLPKIIDTSQASGGGGGRKDPGTAGDAWSTPADSDADARCAD